MTRTPGLTGIEEAGQELHAARLRLAAATGTARIAAFTALKAGASEVKVAKHLGVDRNTIRRWQGK